MNKYEKRTFVINLFKSIEQGLIYDINKDVIPEKMDRETFSKYVKNQIEEKIKTL